jgi:hypothetical protein
VIQRRPHVRCQISGYLDAEAQVDAVLAVQAGKGPGHLPAEYPQQRQLRRRAGSSCSLWYASQREELRREPSGPGIAQVLVVDRDPQRLRHD